MKKNFVLGETVYIIENATHVREAVVVRTSGEFCVIRLSGGGGTRLRESRLFRSRTEAEESVRLFRKAHEETGSPEGSSGSFGDIGWLG